MTSTTSAGWIPKKKIYVLQNRRYTKAGRMMLSAFAGPGISSPYRNSYSVQGRIGYYFSEAWGFEAFGFLTSNSENNTYANLKTAVGSGTLPVVREFRSEVGAAVSYVPWYAKINVFNSILYFDWYFMGGVTSIQAALDTRGSTTGPASYTNQSLLGIFAAMGHNYHLSDSITIRADFSGAFYPRPPSAVNTGDNAWYSDYNFGVGIGWRI